MSDNPFEEFVNSLDVEGDKPTAVKYGLRDIEVKTWAGSDVFDFDAFSVVVENTAAALRQLQEIWIDIDDEGDD